MPVIAYLCENPICREDRIEVSTSIKDVPLAWWPCECGAAAERLWEMPQFICDRADQDVDVVPPEFQVSDQVTPETVAQGAQVERAYQKQISSRRRQIADDGGGSIKQTHSVPAHLYHGKIRQTGDKSYWLDSKNRNKHKSTRVDTYGRSRRGKG